MKKIIIISFLLSIFCSYSNEPSLENFKIPKIINKRDEVNFGLTFSWYHIGSTSIKDVSGNTDRLLNDKVALAPGFSVSIVKFWRELSVANPHVSLHWGLQMSISKKKEVVVQDFLEPGNTTSLIEVKQDVKDFRLTPFFEWRHILRNNIKINLNCGIPCSFKGFENFKLYEKATRAYTGQRLKSEVPKPFVQLGAGIGAKLFKYEWDFKFQYLYSFGSVKYGKKIYIDTPDLEASEPFQDQLLLTDKDSIFLPEHSKLPVRCHSLIVSFRRNF